MELSPIIVFVYNRPMHTQLTIESLLGNALAKESDLYVFADGIKIHDDNNVRQAEEQKINRVRNIIKTVKGFKKINIYESSKNKGLANSVIEGVSSVLSRHQSAIVLEDDIICSPNFLTYMNSALNYYKNNIKIFSVSGYVYPIRLPEKHKYCDVFPFPRASTWGWGTWANRWKLTDWMVNDYKEFIENKKAQKIFNLGGPDLSHMLKAQMEGKIDSWGIRWCYAHYKNNAFSIFPFVSLVKNIGFDGTGVHSRFTLKYEVKLPSVINYKFNFADDLYIDEKIMKRIQRFFHFTKLQALKNKFLNWFKGI